MWGSRTAKDNSLSPNLGSPWRYIYRHGLPKFGETWFGPLEHLDVCNSFECFVPEQISEQKLLQMFRNLRQGTNFTIVFPILGLANYRFQINLFFCAHNMVALRGYFVTARAQIIL